MALTGEAELFFLAAGVGQFLVVALSLAIFMAAADVLVVAVFVQGPLKGSVFACVPLMTVFLVAGSKNAVALFAGSWA